MAVTGNCRSSVAAETISPCVVEADKTIAVGSLPSTDPSHTCAGNRPVPGTMTADLQIVRLRALTPIIGGDFMRGAHGRSIEQVKSLVRFGELVSISSALLLAGGAAYFFWALPGWTPTSEWPQYALAWVVIGYLAIQLISLLDTVMNVRLTGMIDAVASIIPFVIGIVALVNMAQGVLKLSFFQANALALLLALSLLDFVVTMWIRFAVNRRTLGLDVGGS